MKKILLVLLVLIGTSFSQNYRYAWLSDVHVGNPTGANDLIKVVKEVNLRKDLSFVVITGDIAERGKNSELDSAKKILSALKLPYYIIPGNHDTKWSESGCMKFKQIFGDDKFFFDYKGVQHIGLCSGILWRGGGGHIASDDLEWLKAKLKNIPKNKEIVLYTHHPLDGDVDNWYSLLNIFYGYNLKAVMVGHGHGYQKMKFGSTAAVMGRSTLSAGKTYGYTIVDYGKDSISYYEFTPIDSLKFYTSIKKNESKVSKVDSLNFINYNANVLFTKELKTTISTSLVYDKDYIYTATADGFVYCLNHKGKQVWKTNCNYRILSKPVLVDNVLYTGNMKGDLFAINAKSGKIIKKLKLNEPITSRLISYKGNLFLGTSTGKTYLLNLKSLKTIWTNEDAKGMIESLPLVLNNCFVYGSWDSYLYCIDASTGKFVWRWSDTKSTYFAPASCIPVNDDKAIYVMTPDKYITKIDFKTGLDVWRSNKAEGWETIGISNDKKILYIKGLENKFYFVSADDGTVIKEIDLKFGIDTIPLEIFEQDGTIVFGLKNGLVYSIDNNYNVKKILYDGTSRSNSVYPLAKNLYVMSNMDGRITLFSLK